jgi:hypothetical protein
MYSCQSSTYVSRHIRATVGYAHQLHETACAVVAARCAWPLCAELSCKRNTPYTAVCTARCSRIHKSSESSILCLSASSVILRLAFEEQCRTREARNRTSRCSQSIWVPTALEKPAFEKRFRLGGNSQIARCVAAASEFAQLWRIGCPACLRNTYARAHAQQVRQGNRSRLTAANHEKE